MSSKERKLARFQKSFRYVPLFGNHSQFFLVLDVCGVPTTNQVDSFSATFSLSTISPVDISLNFYWFIFFLKYKMGKRRKILFICLGKESHWQRKNWGWWQSTRYGPVSQLGYVLEITRLTLFSHLSYLTISNSCRRTDAVKRQELCYIWSFFFLKNKKEPDPEGNHFDNHDFCRLVSKTQRIWF